MVVCVRNKVKMLIHCKLEFDKRGTTRFLEDNRLRVSENKAVSEWSTSEL